MAIKNIGRFSVRVNDPDIYAQLRLVLAYEAEMRGLSLGQTCAELIREAVEFEKYPPELRERIDQIREEGSRRAVESVLNDGDA